MSDYDMIVMCINPSEPTSIALNDTENNQTITQLPNPPLTRPKSNDHHQTIGILFTSFTITCIVCVLLYYIIKHIPCRKLYAKRQRSEINIHHGKTATTSKQPTKG